MDFPSIIINSPLSTGIATVIAIVSLLGYYFFVIPMIKEKEIDKARIIELETERRNLQDAINSQLALKLDVLNRIVEELQRTLDDQSEQTESCYRGIDALSEAVAKVRLSIESGGYSTQFERMQNSISNVLETTRSASLATQSREDSILHTIAQLQSSINSINEKQHQVLGALMGLSRIQDHTRGINN